MPRGRPKGSKNKATLAKTNLLELPEVLAPSPATKVKENTVEINTSSKQVVQDVATPAAKVSSYCQICGSPIYSSPCILHIGRITGKAEYFREATSNKLTVCSKCSKELSDVIDKWLLNKNPKLMKIPVPLED